MATIAATNVNTSGKVTVTRTTLTSSDTFYYNSSYNPVLILDNVTAGALTVVIDGSGTTTLPVAGYGGSLDLSAGL